MSPEELETHNKVKGAAFGDLRTWIDGGDLGELLCDGALLINEDADLSTEPNVMFCSWERLESGRVQFREVVAESERYVEVTGAPDLIVEVVSKTSIRKDTVIFPERYFVAGAEEYWLIDARGREVDFQLFRRGSSAFETVPVDTDGMCCSQVLSADVKLSRERNRRGTYRYTLELRAMSS